MRDADPSHPADRNALSSFPGGRYARRFFAKLGVSFHGTVLDVGCGDGHLANVIAQTARTVVAVDIEACPAWGQSIAPNVTFAVADAQALQFDSDSFDAVVAINMLHHAQEPTRAIREIIRVTKPTGTIVIVEPNRINPLGYVHLTLMGNHQHFRTSRFVNMVSAALPVFELRRFECHCYPLPRILTEAAELLEDILDNVSLWRPWIFYNAVIATKPAPALESLSS